MPENGQAAEQATGPQTLVRVLDQTNRPCPSCGSTRRFEFLETPILRCSQCTCQTLRAKRESAAEMVAADITELFDAGCSPAEALDFFMTTKGLMSKREWADARGVTERAVRKNVTEAENELSD